MSSGARASRGRQVGLGGSVLLAMALTACSPSWEMASDAPVVKDPDEIVRPVDSYMPTVNEMLGALDSREREINECLAAAGTNERFQYPERTAVAAYLSTGVEDRRTRGDIWGFFSPSTARTLGYQRQDPSPPIQVAPLSAAGQEFCGMLLPGDPDPLLLFTYGSLPDGGPPSVADDPEVERAIRGWRDCMAASGYSYELPTDPPLEFVEESDPSERQLSTARTDLRCKEETNLIALVLERQQKKDELYIAQHDGELGARH